MSTTSLQGTIVLWALTGLGCYTGSGVPLDSSGVAVGGSAGGSAEDGSVEADAAASGLPCDVYRLLADRCTICHSAPLTSGAPMTLVTYADLAAKALGDPTKNEAELSLARMQSATAPMPPKPSAPATATEITTLQSWIAGGMAPGACGADGGAAPGGIMAP